MTFSSQFAASEALGPLSGRRDAFKKPDWRRYYYPFLSIRTSYATEEWTEQAEPKVGI